MQKVIFMKKAEANAVCGTLTQTSKMPCKSYSLPTEACQTGYKMAQIEGSICSACYANKGFYRAYESTIKPSQFARLDSLTNPHWVDGMVALIGSDSFFRWHDSGDLQGVDHLEKIARVAQLTPKTRHWLPTREYGMIKAFIAKHGALPDNLIVRLSAMYPDKPVVVPKSLQGAKNVAISNVHTDKPMGTACKAPNQNGACNDCRLCWSTDTVSYALH
jgi:hypothetical protein